MGQSWTIVDAGRALREHEVSSRELVAAGFAQADRLDAELTVYVERFDETALAAAEQADRDLAAGIDRGPLHGIPIGVKDMILTREAPTTANSLVRNPAWEVRRDASVITRLREAGAVVTGKVSTMEFAFGAVDPGGPFRLPRTPWDTGHWAGGSSSGSGAGVAAGMFLGALGTDTAGSVRLPSAYCGITGHKPTFGLVSQDGMIPLSLSLDAIGPMTRSAADAGLVLQAIAGHDPRDPHSVDVAIGDRLSPAGISLRGLRVGVERRNHFSSPDTDPALEPSFDVAVGVLQEAGAVVSEVALPYYDEVVGGVLVQILADVMAYHRALLQEQWSSYQRATRLGFAGGLLFTAGDLAQVQKVRRAVRRLVHAIFGEVDVIVTPTTASAAWPVATDSDAEQIEVARVMASIYTCYWNAIGSPAVSIPMGFGRAGLPLGLQVIGRPFEDTLVLGVADAYQRSTDWHLRVPPLVEGGARV